MGEDENRVCYVLYGLMQDWVSGEIFFSCNNMVYVLTANLRAAGPVHALLLTVDVTVAITVLAALLTGIKLMTLLIIIVKLD